MSYTERERRSLERFRLQQQYVNIVIVVAFVLFFLQVVGLATVSASPHGEYEKRHHRVFFFLTRCHAEVGVSCFHESAGHPSE